MLRKLLIALAIVALAPGAGLSADLPEEPILYTALRPANWDLYLFASPGQAPRRLTDDPALDYNAVFSPDGRWIVFCSERRGNPDLYALEVAGHGEPVLLTDSDALEDAPSFSPDGKTLAFVSTRDGNADIFVMPFRPEREAPSAEAKNLTEHASGDFNPAFSPDGRQIAFASDRDGYKASEIYVMDADGAGVRRLTESDGWDGSPAWSADDKAIYFYSERDGKPRIYRIAAGGGKAEPVSASGASALSPAVLPDGRIAYASSSDGKSRIVSVAADGSDQRLESDAARAYWAPDFDAQSGRLVCHGPGPRDGDDSFASRTPGRFLIDNRHTVALPDRRLRMWAVRGYFPSLDASSEFVATDEGFHRVVISRLDGGDLRKVFAPESGQAWRPTWSKAGDWLAVSVGPTFAKPGADTNIWKFRADGSGAVNLTEGSGGNDAFPDFSPDGKRIVFRSGRDGNHEIYLMNADGSSPKRLTDEPATDTMPAFAPDGRRIAFTSQRDGGDYEVYVLDLEPDGSPGAVRRVTHSPGRDTHPKFSPDGKWLVIASERGGINDESPLIPVFNPQPYGDIFAVRLEDGETVRLTHNKWEDGTPTWGQAAR